jgi:tight adherence protein B
MDAGLIVVLVVAFVAVVFGLEGLYMLWNDSRGPEVQRLQRRVRLVSAGTHGRSTTDLLKRQQGSEAAWLDRLFLALPRLSSLDRLVEQAGLDYGISRFFGLGLAIWLVVVVLGLAARGPWLLVVLLGLMLACVPFLWLIWKRNQRISQLEAQMPDAIDLIARAMRAGHAFPSALQMVGEESPDPLAAEFRIVHDELNFGLGMDEAFRNLSRRVPSDDMRFFVIAVLLQRETGGNLAEVLGNLATLVRDRFKLLGKVRVLAAEGKLSAWILGLMPIVLAVVINIINPNFMSTLWKDPLGLKLIYSCVILYGIGVLWMYKLIRLRV